MLCIRATRSLVDEHDVREVVEMTRLACQHESSGHSERRTATALASAVAVEEARVVRASYAAVLELERARRDRCQLIAGSAAQPAREGYDGNPDAQSRVFAS
jgi:hypothetical protein